MKSNVAMAGFVTLIGCAGSTAQRDVAPGDGSSAQNAVDGESTAGKRDALRVTLDVPLLSEKFSDTPVARVEDDFILVSEVANNFVATRGAHGGGAQGEWAELSEILDRLITVRLIAQEATTMEMHQLPEVQKELADFGARLMRDLYKQSVFQDIEPDAEKVEAAFQKAVREWRLKSLLFAKPDEANALVAAVRAGGNFDELGREAIAAGRAQGGEDAPFVPVKDLLPQLVAALEKAGPGVVADPVTLPKGVAVVRLEEVRFPENAVARTQAEQSVVMAARQSLLRTHYEELVGRYATIDTKLLERTNLEGKKPDFATLLKDRRALVTIRGEAPVTIGDLCAAIAEDYFHGVEPAIREKQLNDKKRPALEKLLGKRLFAKAAAEQRIDATPEYKNRMRQHEVEVLVGLFVDRVLMPEIKVTEGEIAAYRDAHLAELSYPAFYKLSSIAFTSVEAAEAAVETLRRGTDFKWLKSNAAGRSEAGSAKLQLEDTTVAESGLEPELARALVGARAGDLRVLTTGSETHYVVQVVDYVPPKPQPYEEVREVIARSLYADHVNAAIREWGKKLRAAYEVKTYIHGYGG